MMRNAAAVAVAAVLLGCSGDLGPGARTLTPADVQGVYRICTLRFTPVQTALPPVDLFARVIDPAPAPPAQGASLTLSGAAPEFELVYTHRGDGALRRCSATWSTARAPSSSTDLASPTISRGGASSPGTWTWSSTHRPAPHGGTR